MSKGLKSFSQTDAGINSCAHAQPSAALRALDESLAPARSGSAELLETTAVKKITLQKAFLRG
jgi:hypothetical protein